MPEEKKKDLNMELVRKLAKLEKAKAALKAAMDRIDAKLEPIRDTVTDQMIDNGISNMTVGDRTVYVRHDIWAKLLKDKPAAVEALKKAGMDIYLSESFNMNSLSAYVRERINNKEPLPESFKGVIDASHVYKARTIKS